nr:nucleotide-binding alpha-beta plait domain-containing protein [Tanacetum cinerariifolium]
QVITSLHNEFDMTDLGALNYFLGISATRYSTGLFLSQKHYTIELLARAHMTNCNPSRTPVDTDSKLGPEGVPAQDPTLYRSLAGCPSTRRSTSGYCVFLRDNLLSWSSKRQHTISRSSAEAEYRGVANVVVETAWLRNLLQESQRSKEDDVQNISTSVFVTNFPDQYGAKDLWNSCKVYGQVVDAYIPDRRSKAGKRFGFVRFIKVFDVKRLISNLCMIWVGRFQIHANVARFQREPMNKQKDKVNANITSKVNAASRKNGDGSKRTVNSYAYAVTRYHGYKEPIDNIPTMVLDEMCLNNEEYSLSLLGKVKEFAMMKLRRGSSLMSLWFSQIIQAHNEFNLEERVMWVEIAGVPCKWWSKNTFKIIASRWGTMLNGDELEEGGFHINRLCICTKMKTVLMESFKMVYCGKVCWVHAIEVPGWVPDFEEDSDVDTNDGSHEDEVQDINSDDRNNLEGDSDIDQVLETCIEDKSNKQCMDENFVRQSEPQSEEAFGIYDVLKKKVNVCNNVNADDDVLEDNKTRNDKEDEGSVWKENRGRSAGGTDTNVSTCSGHSKKSGVPRTRGSIIQLIDNLVTVGQTMGYDMKGCIKNLEEIIESKGVNDIHR